MYNVQCNAEIKEKHDVKLYKTLKSFLFIIDAVLFRYVEGIVTFFFHLTVSLD